MGYVYIHICRAHGYTASQISLHGSGCGEASLLWAYNAQTTNAKTTVRFMSKLVAGAEQCPGASSLLVWQRCNAPPSARPWLYGCSNNRTADGSTESTRPSEPSPAKVACPPCLLKRLASVALRLLTSLRAQSRSGLIVAGIGGCSGCQRRRKGLPAGPPTRSYCMRLL